jgi:methanogenic corrinoid protein MtbC1
MEAVLSPRTLATAIGVSESSLKRWADEGLIRVSRTAGGHRRILLSEAIRFIREKRYSVVRPEVLGLGELGELGEVRAARRADAQAALFQALHDGDAQRVRAQIIAAYVEGDDLAALLDGPVRAALTRLGELWQHANQGIFIEHRATDLCVQALGHLRSLLPAPAPGATVAVGAGPPDDPYLLPSIMAALVLADLGYRAVNLGPETPVDVLADAAGHCGARLVWLSVSSPIEPGPLRRQVAKLAEAVARFDADLVVGGRQVDTQPLQFDPPNAHVVHSMHELALFAKGLSRSGAGSAPAGR